MCVVGGATCFKKQKKCDNLFDRDFQASSTLVPIKTIHLRPLSVFHACKMFSVVVGGTNVYYVQTLGRVRDLFYACDGFEDVDETIENLSSVVLHLKGLCLR